MVLYEIKLINTDSKEVVYYKLAAKPQLPSFDLVKHNPGCQLVITTMDSSVAKVQPKITK